MNKTSSLIWGLILVCVGVVFGLNALDLTDINIFFKGWWTLFIIIPSIISLCKNEGKTGSIIWLVFGICLLLGCWNLIDFNIIWKLMIPFILIMIGLSIIFKDAISGKVRQEIKKINKKGLKEYCATFSGQDIEFSDEEFKGCSLSAVFGSVKCDLRDSIIKGDAVIEATAIFGGIEIIAPTDVNVKISSTPIFGGTSDERKKKSKDAKYTIYINATSIFGGVEIK